MGKNEVPAHDIDTQIWDDLMKVIDIARYKHKNGFASAHEGIGIIREEYLELEKEIFSDNYINRPVNTYVEALHLAAMAICFADEVTTKEFRDIKSELRKIK